MKIGTKQMSNGKWVCYTTVAGFGDQSFEGKSKLEAQDLMIKFLKRNNKYENIEWEQVQIIPKRVYTPRKPAIGYARNRIDNL